MLRSLTVPMTTMNMLKNKPVSRMEAMSRKVTLP